MKYLIYEDFEFKAKDIDNINTICAENIISKFFTKDSDFQQRYTIINIKIIFLKKDLYI